MSSTLFKSNPPLFNLSNSFNRSNQPPSGISNLFNKSNPPPSNHKKIDEEPIGEFLWHDACCYMGIKDFSPKHVSFREYIWEVIAFIVIIGKGHSSLNIWQETPNQGTDTEDIILKT